MNITDIIFIVFGAISVLTGLASMFTGKVYGMGSSADKYTNESLARYARPTGAAKLLMGAGLIVSCVFRSNMIDAGSSNAGIGLAVFGVTTVIAIVIYVFAGKLLVKKNA